MIDGWSLAAVIGMALATYTTRISGYLLLGNRVLTPRMSAVLDTAPGCVLISVISPAFATSRPADLLAVAITLLAAIRLPLLATVCAGVASAALARWFLG